MCVEFRLVCGPGGFYCSVPVATLLVSPADPNSTRMRSENQHSVNEDSRSVRHRVNDVVHAKTVSVVRGIGSNSPSADHSRSRRGRCSSWPARSYAATDRCSRTSPRSGGTSREDAAHPDADVEERLEDRVVTSSGMKRWSRGPAPSAPSCSASGRRPRSRRR